MESFSIAGVDQLEGEGPGGIVRQVRRALDAKPFGCN